MRITTISSLFPPDVDPVAAYTKQLASELVRSAHNTLLIYGYLPEQITGVDIVTVDKRQGLLARIIQMFTAMRQVAKSSDVLLVNNGPSVELPAILLSFIQTRPIIYIINDEHAHEYAQKHFFYHWLTRLMTRRAAATLDITKKFKDLQKPLIHPMQPYPTDALVTWEQHWQQHTQIILDTCSQYV